MTLAARIRAASPERLKEPARLRLAARLDARTRASAAVRGAALVLHAVAPRAGDPAFEIDPPMSTAHLDALVSTLRARYALVRASELLPAAAERRPGEPLPVALTFDDDLPSHLEHAAPVLARHGAVATAFLCGAQRPFWWRALQQAVDGGALAPTGLPGVAPELVAAALDRRPWAIGRLAKAVEDLEPAARDAATAALLEAAPAAPLPLTRDGAHALAGHGWEIGFHTRRHDVLPRLADTALGAALRDGRDALPGRPVTLAYPHGKAGAREAAAARAAGYAAAFTGAAEVLTDRSDAHLIGRLQPAPMPVGGFALELARALAHGVDGTA